MYKYVKALLIFHTITPFSIVSFIVVNILS